jgi:hypothetical protein
MSKEIALSKPNALMPTEAEWNLIKDQATVIVSSGFLPQSIKTPAQAIAIAVKGRELGIPMMQAFAHIHIIQGKPAISSELMLALIFRNVPGAVVDYIETSNTSCTIEAKRPGGKKATFKFTMEDAQKAQLLSKGPWISYPGAMLRARTIAIMARALFPDAIMGCSYTPEELDAEVDEDGSVIDVTPPLAKPAPIAQEQKAPPASVAKGPSPVTPATVIAPKVKTKATVGAEILATAEKLGLSDNDLSQWAYEHSKVSKEKMTVPQLEAFLGVLQYELGRNGEAV